MALNVNMVITNLFLCLTYPLPMIHPPMKMEVITSDISTAGWLIKLVKPTAPNDSNIGKARQCIAQRKEADKPTTVARLCVLSSFTDTKISICNNVSKSCLSISHFYLYLADCY